MDEYKCKLCLKNFINGRALGGHMRSHMFNHEPSDSLSQYTDSLSSEEDENDGSETDDNLLGNRESETESSKHLTRRRSKRIRSWDMKSSQDQCKSESEPVSSISNTTPDEDVAYCLMMLSRDKWRKQRDRDETGSNDIELRCKYKKQTKYKCETCGRAFRSYQALGGHRANHKKLKAKERNREFEFSRPLMAETDKDGEKVHKCPYCFRVFASGQALGGHKRSHVAGSLGVNNKNVEKMIDLNLPAPNDDDDGISQVEVSAVTNGE